MVNGRFVQEAPEHEKRRVFDTAARIKQQSAQSIERGDSIDYHLAALQRLKDEVHRQYGEA